MSEKVAMLDALLTSDQSDPLGPCGSSPNLLPIHYQLRQLEAFRNETLHQAKQSAAQGEQGQQDRQTLVMWFERLDDLGNRFEEWMWAIASHLLETVREGNGGVIVRLLKIIEVEGKEDQKAVALRLIRKAGGAAAAGGGAGGAGGNVENASARDLQAKARIIKNYRHKLLDKMTASVKRSFDDAEVQFGGDGVSFVDGLTWMFKDLDRIETDVKPLFPPDYKVWEFYVKAYHARLNEALQKIVHSHPEARVLLRLHAWTKEYRSVMKEFEVPEAWLQPPLLDGRAQELVEDYVGLIVEKFDKWTVNLMRSESKEFTSRQAPPEIDSDGTYVLQFAVIMFQMANQQVDLAADSGQGAVLARVVAESARVMTSCQHQWVKILDQEYTTQVNQPDIVTPGLVEYVMALANDQLKAADYAEAMSARLEPLVSEKYRKVIAERLNEAIDGYLDVAKRCISVLIDLIFNDLKTVTKSLFTSTSWYTDPLMDQIVETIRDYVGDCKGHLNPSIFDILIEDLLVRFLTIYLNALRRVAPRGLKIPAAIEKIKSEIGQVYDFFAEYKRQDDAGAAGTTALDADFEIMNQIIAILAAPPDMVFMDYWPFAQHHGPNLAFTEAILRGRDDLDKHQLNHVVETIKRKVKEQGLGEPEEPTIMVKVDKADVGLLNKVTSKAAQYAGGIHLRVRE